MWWYSCLFSKKVNKKLKKVLMFRSLLWGRPFPTITPWYWGGRMHGPHSSLMRLQHARSDPHGGLGCNLLESCAFLCNMGFSSSAWAWWGTSQLWQNGRNRIMERMILVQLSLVWWGPNSTSVGSCKFLILPGLCREISLASPPALLVPHPRGQGCLWTLWLSDYPGLWASQMCDGAIVPMEGFQVPFYAKIWYRDPWRHRGSVYVPVRLHLLSLPINDACKLSTALSHRLTSEDPRDSQVRCTPIWQGASSCLISLASTLTVKPHGATFYPGGLP